MNGTAIGNRYVVLLLLLFSVSTIDFLVHKTKSFSYYITEPTNECVVLLLLLKMLIERPK